MTPILQDVHATIARGGPVVWAILALSLLLYTGCFGLLIHLRRTGRGFCIAPPPTGDLRSLRQQLASLDDGFERQRSLLGAMIAAAPLLGLLGTVTGMIRTFQVLAAGGAAQQSGGLAEGISQALIATAAGLSVAIPAMLLLHVAHLQWQRVHQVFAGMEREAMEGRPHV